MSKIVRMVRDPQFYSTPHIADVAESEINSFRLGGYVLTTEATFAVPEQQAALHFPDKSEQSNDDATKQPVVKPQF